MERKSWRWVVLVVAVVISMVGATMALAQKAPDTTSEPDQAPGQVTPLAVGTFDGRVEPVVGTDDRAHLAFELRLPTSRPPTLL